MGNVSNIMLSVAGIGVPGGRGLVKDINNKFLGGKQQSSAPLPLPQAPSIDDASSRGEAISRKRKASQTQSVYTSPLGVSGEANVARKTLLGQ